MSMTLRDHSCGIAIGTPVDDAAGTVFAAAHVGGALAPGVRLHMRKDVHKVDRVAEISAARCGLSAPILALPPMLLRLDISSNEFSGTFNFSILPHTLQSLNIAHNSFHGTADFSCLPAQLLALNMACNRFSGNLDLTQLPLKLTTLHAQDNRFTSCGIALADADQSLVVGRTAPLPVRDFDFSRLPRAFRLLNISGNPLQHRLNLASVPAHVTVWADTAVTHSPF